MNPRRVSLRAFVPPGRGVGRWRASDLPDDVVFVGRPSRWGNPWRIGELVGGSKATRDRVLDLYRTWLLRQIAAEPDFLAPLAGKRLACHCPLDKRCHVDLLLEEVA